MLIKYQYLVDGITELDRNIMQSMQSSFDNVILLNR